VFERARSNLDIILILCILYIECVFKLKCKFKNLLMVVATLYIVLKFVAKIKNNVITYVKLKAT